MVVVVRGGGDNKGEKQLLILNRVEGIFIMMFLQ
jgi:hypothetical protein